MLHRRFHSLDKRLALILITLVLATAFQVAVSFHTTFQITSSDRERYLRGVGTFLTTQIDGSFAEILRSQNALDLEPAEQVRVLNSVLQPLVDRAHSRNPHIEMGYYSIELDSVVAISPFDPSHLQASPRSYPYFRSYETGEVESSYSRASDGWNGAAIIAMTFPLHRDGKIIGHAWTSIRMNDALTASLRLASLPITTGIILIMVMLVMATKFAVKFKNTIDEFTHSAANHTTSMSKNALLPELYPVLELIKQQDYELKQLYQVSPDIIAVFSILKWRFIRANPAVERLLGYTPDEFTSIDHDELLHPDDLLTVEQECDKVKLDKTNFGTTVRFRSKDGGYRWLSWSGAHDPETDLIFAVARDITEQKAMEREILRLDRLNLAGEMAASISHEIRNPMTTVRGFLQLLGQKDQYATDREFLDLMIEELDRANGIITEFLNVAKTKPIDREMTNLNQTIRAILPLIRADALMTNADIVTDLGEIPDQYMDPKEMRQLILNLVRNGLEAMDGRGTVTIKTWAEPGGSVVLAISDQGPGIPANNVDKIFDPFYTTKATGTGLGLSVCHRIATQHHAEIKVETSASGTTFYVIFQLSR